MHAEVLLVFILVLRFETYMMGPIKEISTTMEEPSSGYLNDGTITNREPGKCGFRDRESDIEENKVKPEENDIKDNDIADAEYYDIEDNDIESHRREKNAVAPLVLGRQFDSTNLTYEVILDSSPPPSWFEEVAVMNEIREAFEYWARETPLEFTYWPYGPVDITITFTSNQEACGESDPTFGKQGGTYGCTSNPPMGKVYLDINEDWTIKSFQGTDIFQAATHQIGHALGLEHSRDNVSIMRSQHSENREYFRTAPKDIKDIRSFYGSRKGREIIDEKSVVYKEYIPCLFKRDFLKQMENSDTCENLRKLIEKLVFNESCLQ